MAKGLLKRLAGRETVPQGLTTLAMHARLIALTPASAPVAVNHKHGIRRGLKAVSRLGLRGASLDLYDAAYECDRGDYTPELRAALNVAERAYSLALQEGARIEPLPPVSKTVEQALKGREIAEKRIREAFRLG